MQAYETEIWTCQHFFFFYKLFFFSDSKMSHNTRSSPAGSPIKRPRLTSPVKPRGGGNVGVVGTEYLSPLKTGSSARDLLSGKLFLSDEIPVKKSIDISNYIAKHLVALFRNRMAEFTY